MEHYIFPLIDRREVAEGTMAFWFDTSSVLEFTQPHGPLPVASRGAGFTFEAGQNADFSLIDPPQTDAEGNTRTFSFAASPEHRDSIMIATRMRDTAFKHSLQTLPLGTKVQVSPAGGNMTLHDDSTKPAVFIAGGIGITPFRSMIEDATLKRLPHRLTLCYSNRTPAQTAFLSDLEQWAAQNSNFHLAATITDETDQPWSHERGRINAEFLKKNLPEIAAPIYYLAGPPGLVTAMRTVLLGVGISKDSIKLESFSGY